MISWIQSTFKHHFKLVFALLIAVMVIPLVFIYSTSGGIGQADHDVRERRFFGRPFTTEQDRQEFAADGQLSYHLASGNPFIQPEQVEMYASFRAAKLAIADQLGIPEPTEAQFSEYLRKLGAFAGENGEYDAQAYARFLDMTRNNPVYSQVRVRRVITEDWRAQQATRAIAGPGFVIDPEVREQLAAAETSWTIHSATVNLADVEPEGEPTEAELQAWFTNNGAAYRHPPQIQVSAAEFPAERYRARISQPTDDDIVRHFERNKSTYATPAEPAKEGETAVTPAEPRLEDVRDRVIQEILQERALQAATHAASDLAYEIFDKKVARGTPQFDAQLTQFGTAIRQVPALPITRETLRDPVLREALNLSEDKPVSDPVVVGQTAVLLFFDGRMDATDAVFAEVRERVLADVQADRRRQAVVARGEALRSQLAAAVKAGTPFVDAAKAAGLETKSWENFTRRTPPADFDRSIESRMTEQPVGEVSPMAVQGDTGTLFVVAQRREPVVSSDDPKYGETRQSLMENAALLGAQMILSQMVRAERLAADLDRAEPAAP